MSRREDGVAVVVAMGLTALIVLVAVMSGGVAALVASHRKVQSAADLSALAAATAGQKGMSACGVAKEIAARNGVDLSDCEADGEVVRVIVELRARGVFGSRVLRARARAGPVGAPG